MGEIAVLTKELVEILEKKGFKVKRVFKGNNTIWYFDDGGGLRYEMEKFFLKILERD